MQDSGIYSEEEIDGRESTDKEIRRTYGILVGNGGRHFSLYKRRSDNCSIVCSLTISYTPYIRCMRIVAVYASHTHIMLVIPTGDPITNMIVVGVVAHGRKEKTDFPKENLDN